MICLIPIFILLPQKRKIRTSLQRVLYGSFQSMQEHSTKSYTSVFLFCNIVPYSVFCSYVGEKRICTVSDGFSISKKIYMLLLKMRFQQNTKNDLNRLKKLLCIYDQWLKQRLATTLSFFLLMLI